MAYRPALHINEDATEPQGDVHAENDIPDQPASPAVGESQQCNGEGRLAPGGGSDGGNACDISDEQIVVPVLNIPGVLAEAVMDVDGQQRSLQDETDLTLSEG